MAKPVQTIAATKAKNSFGEILRSAHQTGQHFVVEKGGISVVAIIPIQDYVRQSPREKVLAEAKTKQKARQVSAKNLRALLAELHAAASKITYSEDETDKDIETAIREVRQLARKQGAKKVSSTKSLSTKKTLKSRSK